MAEITYQSKRMSDWADGFVGHNCVFGVPLNLINAGAAGLLGFPWAVKQIGIHMFPVMVLFITLVLRFSLNLLARSICSMMMNGESVSVELTCLIGL